MTKRFVSTFTRLRARGESAFVPFLMLGDPNATVSLQLIAHLVDSGADILELGLPFSDPPGDGPVIQAAGQRALKAGMTTAGALEILRRVRERCDLPISLLCYYNPILQYGVDAFYRDAAVAGVDAVLIADLPLEESQAVVESARQHGVHPVFMVSELTSDTRLAQIAAVGEGYIYVVARVGVTGEQSAIATGLGALLSRCRQQTTLPLLAGFGISTPAHAHQAIEAGADGVICGSAIVRRVAQYGEHPDACMADVRTFAMAIKEATRHTAVLQ